LSDAFRSKKAAVGTLRRKSETSPEFQKAQLTPATLPPRSNYDTRIIFLDAPCFPQSVESHSHTEGFTATEQTMNLANGSPRVVEQFEYLFIDRLRGANSPRRHQMTVPHWSPARVDSGRLIPDNPTPPLVCDVNAGEIPSSSRTDTGRGASSLKSWDRRIDFREAIKFDYA